MRGLGCAPPVCEFLALSGIPLNVGYKIRPVSLFDARDQGVIQGHSDSPHLAEPDFGFLEVPTTPVFPQGATSLR